MSGYGFVRSELEIKTLTLYVLDYSKISVNFDELMSMVFVDDAINYFNFADYLSGMVATGHIEIVPKNGEDRYTITAKGSRDLAAIRSSVPGSVLKKAAAAADKVKEEVHRKNLISAEVIDGEDNFSVSCALNDETGEVFSFRMSAPNRKTAKKLSANFYKNAERIYNDFLRSMLDNGENQN